MPDQEQSPQPVAEFESQLDELEKIVKELESGDLPLEKSLALFERAVQLSSACRQQLEAAETKVEILLSRNNKIQPEPFEASQE